MKRHQPRNPMHLRLKNRGPRRAMFLPCPPPLANGFNRVMICCANCGTCRQEIDAARAAFPQLDNNAICCVPGDTER